MRPNQQNNNKNRSRGRNGGRKHVNPLSRNFESNGPDVKVRGNAAHIAEKYVQLARDAQASGDSVMAENYFQHAEHYFRIVMAAQPQGMPRPEFGQDGDLDEDYLDETADYAPRMPEEQPRMEAAAPRAEREERQPRAERPRRERQPRPDAEPVHETEAAAPEAPVVAEAPAAAEAEGEGEAKRVRRPRRTRRTAEAGNDPANAPQPEIGDLPAFITAGSTTPAE